MSEAPTDLIHGLDDTALAEFKASMRGRVIEPGDPDYDSARRIYNGMIDKRPRLIARCADTADVMTAVSFAREHDLLVAVRGGGHGVAGNSTCDGGMVIDLSLMRGVKVDPETQTARVAGGCVWGDVDHAAHPFGLAVPSGIVSTTGVAGLTLGGGHGYLTRAYGLTCDNLISADVVTAEGGYVKAGPDENEDLLWGLKGGGGNFGVVTSFEFKARPVSTVIGGPLVYPTGKAPDLLRLYRSLIMEAPEEFSMFVGFHIEPPQPFVPTNAPGTPIVVAVVCHLGSQEDAERIMRPLRELGPEADMVGPMPFPALQSMFDPLVPPGLQHYWKGDFFGELTDEAIEVHMEYGPKVPTFRSPVHIYPINGAAQRVGRADTAFSYREANFSTVIAAVFDDPTQTSEMIQWVRDYWSALHPFSLGGAYVNFLMDEGQDRIRATYRDNYDRLAALKAKYDPTNFFHLNQNIPPAG